MNGTSNFIKEMFPYMKKALDSTKWLQAKLDSDTSIPYGWYYVTDELYFTGKHFDFNGAILYSDKDITFLNIDGTEFNLLNLGLSAKLVKNGNKSMIKLRFKDSTQLSYNIDRLRLHGSGNQTGIEFTRTENNGGNLKYMESHWSVINVSMAQDLFEVVNICDKNSRHTINLQNVTRSKKIATIPQGANAIRLFARYNDHYMLTEKEKDMDLVELRGSRCVIEVEVVDWDIHHKPSENTGLYKHKYRVSNYGDTNTLIETMFSQSEVKEERKFWKII